LDADVPLSLALQAGSTSGSALGLILLVLGLLVAMSAGFTAYTAIVTRIGRTLRRRETSRAVFSSVVLIVLSTALSWLGLRQTAVGSAELDSWVVLCLSLWPALAFPLLGALSGGALTTRPESGNLALRAGNLLADTFAFWLTEQAVNGNGHETVEEPDFEITMASGEEVEAEEREYIENILELGATTAREVMTPRPDVEALDLSWEPERVFQAVADARFSRFPVYMESVDNIIGVVHLRSLLEFLARGEGIERLDLRSMLMEPMFVPESKKVDDVLRELQLRKSHMAIVLDEFGGTEGILTIEDLLEEIVGEIQDEYDDESQPVHRREDGNLVVDGQLPLSELSDELGRLLEVEDIETLGGLVTHLLGHIPRVRESIEHRSLRFTVLSVDKNRVRRVLVEHLVGDDAAAATSA
jgi:Mg2+/Co2+ transporter CorC